MLKINIGLLLMIVLAISNEVSAQGIETNSINSKDAYKLNLMKKDKQKRNDDEEKQKTLAIIKELKRRVSREYLLFFRF
jgi:hypothetical protein